MAQLGAGVDLSLLAQAASEIDWTSVGVFGAIAIAIAVAGAKEIWVWGKSHRHAVALERERADEFRSERDRYRDLAFRLSGITENVVERAAKVVYEGARQGEAP